MRALRRLIERDEGQDLVEYALLAGLIVLALAAAVVTLGGDIGGLTGSVFGRASSSVSGAAGS